MIHLLAGPTLGARMIEMAMRPTGFDYLRIILSVTIVCLHSVLMSEGRAGEDEMRGTLIGMTFVPPILPMFFALSGYLVTASLERCRTLVSFYGLRFLRIFPGLAVEVTVSALLLGPLLTSYDLHSYIRDPEFHTYFLNMIGDIHYNLPGVFTNNPLPKIVNGQLWTVPVDIECYAALGVLAVLGITRQPRLLLGFMICLQLVLLVHAIQKPFTAGEGNGPTAIVLIMSFLAGNTLYAWKDKVPWNGFLFCLALLAALLCGYIYHATYMIAFPAAYITVYLGMTNFHKPNFMAWSDYSYGIFIYGFVIQQAFASFGPATQVWYLNILVCLPLSWLLAMFSWKYVEVPALRLRRFLPAIEAKWLEFSKNLTRTVP